MSCGCKTGGLCCAKTTPEVSTEAELRALFERRGKLQDAVVIALREGNYLRDVYGKGVAVHLGKSLGSAWSSGSAWGFWGSGEIIVFWENGDHTVLPDRFEVVSTGVF